jgi:cold-inducible RNA-binding protein
MGKKLYVGNLPYSVNDQKLNDLFASVGEVVSAKVITDHDSGRSKGFGFVEMANDSDAQKAISKLDGHDIDGRNLRVNEARPKEEKR